MLGTGSIYDGDGASDRFDSHVYISTNEQAERAVLDTIAQGWKWVKTYPDIDPTVLYHLMRTANAHGIGVCGHMSKRVDARTLCDWGYECVEHSSSLPRDARDIAYLARAGMWFCPTQVVCETLPDYVWNGKVFADLREYEQFVPPSVKRTWNERDSIIQKMYKDKGLRPDINEVIGRGKTFIEHSDRVLAGSDMAYPGIIPGFSLHDELEKLVTLYGMTPYQSLRAATANTARYMGLAGKKGVLEPGADADLLILNGNPLCDIANTRSIDCVLRGSRLYDRASLDALLMQVEQMTEADEISPIF